MTSLLAEAINWGNLGSERAMSPPRGSAELVLWIL